MLQPLEGRSESPTLDAERFHQIFRRWNTTAFLLEEAVEVPRELVLLVEQDLPLLLREMAREHPELCSYGIRTKSTDSARQESGPSSRR